MGLLVPAALIESVPATQVASYPVIVAPPLFAGAEKATLAEASPGVTVPIVGASGTVKAMLLLLLSESEPPHP